MSREHRGHEVMKLSIASRGNSEQQLPTLVRLDRDGMGWEESLPQKLRKDPLNSVGKIQTPELQKAYLSTRNFCEDATCQNLPMNTM